MQTAAVLPPTVGYVGMDMILGPEGPESDVVLELNPRLTTSYLGLRQLARANLAAAMLAAVAGQPVHVSFGHQHVEFSPDAVTLKAAAIGSLPPASRARPEYRTSTHLAPRDVERTHW